MQHPLITYTKGKYGDYKTENICTKDFKLEAITELYPACWNI